MFTITWSRQTKLAAFISPIIGLVCGLVVWTTTAYHYYNEVTVASLGGQFPCMFGGLTALFLPGAVSIVVSLTIRPYRFDWNQLRRAELIISEEDEHIPNQKIEFDSSEESNGNKENIDKANQTTNIRNRDDETDSDNVLDELLEREEQKKRLLTTYLKLGYAAFISVLLITWVLWPLPLYRDWIWSRAYFKGYITVSLIWVYGALLVIGVYPLIDGRHSAAKIIRGVYNDYLKRG